MCLAGARSKHGDEKRLHMYRKGRVPLDNTLFLEQVSGVYMGGVDAARADRSLQRSAIEDEGPNPACGCRRLWLKHPGNWVLIVLKSGSCSGRPSMALSTEEETVLAAVWVPKTTNERL